MELPVHVRDEYRLTTDIHRLDLSRHDIGGWADAPGHGPLGPAQSYLKQRRAPPKPGPQHQLLETPPAPPPRFLPVPPHCFDILRTVAEPMEADVHGSADHLHELDIDPVIV